MKIESFIPSVYRTACTLFSAILLSSPPARAAVELPAVIGSNMVVQSGEPLNFWGWADVGEKVVIKQGGTVVANAIGCGKDQPWKVQLPPQPPGPVADIEVQGTNTLSLTNILAGEVWLCSGQSNMVQTLKKGPWCGWGGAVDADKEIAAATDQQIRFFVQATAMGQIQTRPKGSWRICSPETAPELSAVACFFARQLRSEIRVPTGLIISAVGGTAAELWTPGRKLEADPEYQKLKKSIQAMQAEFGDKLNLDGKVMAEWLKKVQEAKAKGEAPPPKPTLLLSQEQSATLIDSIPALNAGGLYNGMIRPLVPFNIRGAIWYQGESNARRGELYADLMANLITGWREDWGKPFPFILVALAGFNQPSAWTTGAGSFALVREAQITVASQLPHCGVISAVDVGDAKNIHPLNKQPVGLRAGLWALKNVYGKEVVAEGPKAPAIDFKNGKALVTFGENTLGLTLKAPGGFELAGEDKQFVGAQAELKNDVIEVTAPGLSKPVALRYAFLNMPECTIYNGAGLPALPFRSDNWPVGPATSNAKPTTPAPATGSVGHPGKSRGAAADVLVEMGQRQNRPLAWLCAPQPHD